MNKIKLAIVAVIALLGIAIMAPTATYASTASNSIQGGVNAVGGSDAGNATPLPQRIKTIVNVFLFITGAVAVLMIIIGGIRYVVSAGESSAVKNAKNTILYAVVGLVVAILAYAIINFVVSSLK